jgi:hypothetical protein
MNSQDGNRSSPSLLPPQITVLATDADHRVAVFGPLLISVWIRETRIEALRAMEEMIKVAAGSVPDGRLGLLVVVEPHAKMPSAAVRDELARIRRTRTVALTALVHEGDGFSAALVRGITTSLNLLEGVGTQTHVFANIASAARWVEAKAPQYGSAIAIEEAARALRTSSD